MLNENIVKQPEICLEQNFYWKGFHNEISTKIKSVADYMIDRFSRVYIVRFDIRFPREGYYEVDNKALSVFMNRFKKELKDQGLSPICGWSREQNPDNPHHHYHCLLLLNGHKTYKSHYHLALAEKLWRATIKYDGFGNLIHDAGDGMIMRNGSGFEYDKAINLHWVNYLAKVHTKGNVPKGTRQFGGLNIPK
jgi:hypothetical protein